MREDHDVTVIETDTGSGLKWFLLGAAIGAGVGILLAPGSGKATRRDLAHRGRQLRSRASELVDDFSDEVQRRGRKIRDTVEEFADEVVDDVNEAVEDGERTVRRKGADVRGMMEQRLADARARSRAAAGIEDDEPEAEDEPV